MTTPNIPYLESLCSQATAAGMILAVLDVKALIARAKRCEELERLGATYASARTAWMAPSLHGATRPAAIAFEAAELALRNALTKEQP